MIRRDARVSTDGQSIDAPGNAHDGALSRGGRALSAPVSVS
jgi:hypothetical protein